MHNKKILAVLLASAITVTGLTGCAGKSGGNVSSTDTATEAAMDSSTEDSTDAEDPETGFTKKSEEVIVADMKKSGIFPDAFFIELPSYEQMKKDMEDVGIIPEVTYEGEEGNKLYYSGEETDLAITELYGGTNGGYMTTTRNNAVGYIPEGISSWADYDLLLIDELVEDTDEETLEPDELLKKYPVKAAFSTEDCVYYSEIENVDMDFKTETDEGVTYPVYTDSLVKKPGNTLCHLVVNGLYSGLDIYCEKSELSKYVKLVQKWGFYKNEFKDLTAFNTEDDIELFMSKDSEEEYTLKAKQWFEDTYNVDADGPMTYDEDGYPRNITDEELAEMYADYEDVSENGIPEEEMDDESTETEDTSDEMEETVASESEETE